MDHDGVTTHPLGRRDTAALVGVAAVLEGHLLCGDLGTPATDALSRHLQKAGLLAAGAGPAELRLALANLGQRLRFALGEYAEPPVPETGAADQYFGFATEPAAGAFAAAAAARGESVTRPAAVGGGAHDGEIGWQVVVRTAELPLSRAFDEHVQRLSALADGHGGSYGGWAGAAG